MERGIGSRLELLYDCSCAFAARLDIDQLLPFVIAKCREALNSEGASILLLDADSGELYFPYVSDEPKVAERLRRLRFPADRGIAGAVLKSGRALRVDDAQNDPRFNRDIDKKSGSKTCSILAVPLNSRRGAMGVIEVVNARGRAAFSADDLLFLETLSGNIAIAIENATLYSQVRDSEAELQTKFDFLHRDLARAAAFAEIVGTGPAMGEVFSLVESAAAASIAVLIEGETGTGKELIARAIHRASARNESPFLAINCAAIPDTLLESELFGYRKGAFTGAIRDSPGLFKSAHGGVVFLDEIGDMPLAMQAKMLRVLEEQEVVALGDSFPRKVDVRVISATNHDLNAQVADGSFRADLYYRLAVFPIWLPPLRERIEDIPILAARFLAEAAQRNHKRVEEIGRDAMEMLATFQWPGNVRQLRNEIERALALAKDGETLSPQHFYFLSPTRTRRSAPSPAVIALAPANPPEPPAAPASDPMQASPVAGKSLRQAKLDFESAYVALALKAHDGNITRAARALGLSRVALQKKVRTYRTDNRA